MILVITHDGSDFDAIASSMLLTKVYTNSFILKPENMEEPVLNFLKETNIEISFIKKQDLKLKEIDKIIFSDRDLNSNLLNELKIKNIPIEIFDHHTNKGFGSNVSLVLNCFKKYLKKITPNEALLALLGIYQDTGNLTYGSTEKTDFSASAYFLQFKPMIHRIPYYIKLFEIDINGIKIIKSIIDNSVTIGPKYFRIMISHYINKEYYFGYSLLMNHLINLLDLKGIFVLFIFKNKTFLTARSAAKDLNVNDILNKLQKGKGHPFASTRVIRRNNHHDVKRELKHTVTEFIFKRSLGSYLKFVDIKPYIEKAIKDKVLSSKISLWDYYDNYVKDLRPQIKFRKYILSYRIFKEILPRVFFKPVLIPQKDRKKHPILLSFKKYFSKYFSVSIIDLFQQIKQIGDKDHLNIFLVGGIPRDLLIAHLNSKNKI
ncbi:hypothetical protein J7L48_05705, partial [bacterium]|nr:hypothetical protein [bacterium]